jgi:phage terminase large subunit
MKPDQYDHIWDGGYVKIVEGAYIAKELAAAKAEGRIGHVAADPLMTIRLFADIGGTGAKADNFVFWAAQFIGREIRVLDHYEVQGQPIGAHLNWLRGNGYTPDRAQIWLPHDGETHDRVYDESYESAFQKTGYSVTVVPNQGKGAAMLRVEAVRRRMPSIWFDEKKTEGGREALGWYHEKKDEKRGIGLGPDHDWSSHSFDGFGLMCVAYEEPRAARAEKRPPRRVGANSWMGV